MIKNNINIIDSESTAVCSTKTGFLLKIIDEIKQLTSEPS